MKLTFKDIQQGTYHAEVSEIKQNQGAFGPFLRITFTIVAGELKNYKFCGLVKPTALKQSKFYKWVTYILGEKPEDDFDTKELIGKHCLVVLSKSKDFYSVTDVYRQNHASISSDVNLDSITGMPNRSQS